MKDIPDYAVQKLALAVITRAALDYHRVLKKGDMANVTRAELERFFHSNFFALATDNYPPDLFIRKIERGECYATKKHEHRSVGQLNRKPPKARLSLL